VIASKMPTRPLRQPDHTSVKQSLAEDVWKKVDCSYVSIPTTDLILHAGSQPQTCSLYTVNHSAGSIVMVRYIVQNIFLKESVQSHLIFCRQGLLLGSVILVWRRCFPLSYQTSFSALTAILKATGKI